MEEEEEGKEVDDEGDEEVEVEVEKLESFLLFCFRVPQH